MTLHRHRHAIVPGVHGQHFGYPEESYFALFLEPLHHGNKYFGDLVVILRQHAVDLEDIDIVGFKSLKTLLQGANRDLRVFDRATGIAISPLGSDEVRVSRMTAQRTTQHGLGLAVRFSRVEQVYAQLKCARNKGCAPGIIESCSLAELGRPAGTVAEK